MTPLHGIAAGIASSLADDNEFFSLETAQRAAIGAVTGSITGGFSSLRTLGTLVIGGVAGGAGNAANQGLDIKFNGQTEFDRGEFGVAIASGTLGAVASAGSKLAGPTLSFLEKTSLRAIGTAKGLLFNQAGNAIVDKVSSSSSGSFDPTSVNPSGASGGFVIYPNKQNTNMMVKV